MKVTLHPWKLSSKKVTLYASTVQFLLDIMRMKAVEKAPEISQESKRVLEAISNPERYGIMIALNHHKEGLSFSQLAKIFAKNHNTLDRHLKALTHSTLIWNFYERREGKEHSFYRLSALGERLLNDLKREIEIVA